MERNKSLTGTLLAGTTTRTQSWQELAVEARLLSGIRAQLHEHVTTVSRSLLEALVILVRLRHRCTPSTSDDPQQLLQR